MRGRGTRAIEGPNAIGFTNRRWVVSSPQEESLVVRGQEIAVSEVDQLTLLHGDFNESVLDERFDILEAGLIAGDESYPPKSVEVALGLLLNNWEAKNEFRQWFERRLIRRMAEHIEGNLTQARADGVVN